MRTLVVATTNRGKLRELRSLLSDLPADVRSLTELAPQAPPVVEDGATFADNAVKKARAAAAATGALALADDSGLEVDVLGGRPGVKSARFAGEGASDEENVAALLDALARSGAPPPHSARFRCVLALVDPGADGGADRSPAHLVEGRCEGVIAAAARGRHGFGYDPVFVVEGGALTMAELSPAEKDRVSHRARAAAALRALLAGARLLG